MNSAKLHPPMMAVHSFATAFDLLPLGRRDQVSNSIGGLILSPFVSSAVIEPCPTEGSLSVTVVGSPPKMTSSSEASFSGSRQQSSANFTCADLHVVELCLYPSIKKLYTPSHVADSLLKSTLPLMPSCPG